MKRIFSILFAVVLVLTLSLVTAVPVAAGEDSDVELATVGSATAELSTEQAHSGNYSVKFHAVNWGPDGYALGIPVDTPLNEITELSYWRNGVGFGGKGFVDYAPPDVLLCVDANGDGELDFDIQEAIEVMTTWNLSLLGNDAIFGIGADWIATDNGWTKVNGLTNSYWPWGGAWCLDKTGWSGWVWPCSSLQDFTGFGTVDPTDHVMMVVIAGGNPDGDLYIDDLTINGIPYDFEPPLPIEVDIKPGSDPNSINLKSKGVVPVAVLTTEDFDASDVNPDTARFGPGEAEAVHWALEDVDDDGDIDLILHFKTQDTGISPDDTEATLIAYSYDGLNRLIGTDTVNIVPKGK